MTAHGDRSERRSVDFFVQVCLFNHFFYSLGSEDITLLTREADTALTHCVLAKSEKFSRCCHYQVVPVTRHDTGNILIDYRTSGLVRIDREEVTAFLALKLLFLG